MISGDLNSGPHICTANTSTTEPSPWPLSSVSDPHFQPLHMFQPIIFPMSHLIYVLLDFYGEMHDAILHTIDLTWFINFLVQY